MTHLNSESKHCVVCASQLLLTPVFRSLLPSPISVSPLFRGVLLVSEAKTTDEPPHAISYAAVLGLEQARDLNLSLLDSSTSYSLTPQRQEDFPHWQASLPQQKLPAGNMSKSGQMTLKDLSRNQLSGQRSKTQAEERTRQGAESPRDLPVPEPGLGGGG